MDSRGKKGSAPGDYSCKLMPYCIMTLITQVPLFLQCVIILPAIHAEESHLTMDNFKLFLKEDL